MKKYALFFWLAAIPSLISLKDQPATAWGWWLYIGQAIGQGLLAMKALQSSPEPREVTTNIVSALLAEPVPPTE